MPGSRHFSVNTIKKDLPENINEIEIKKWQNIGYLLEPEESPIEKRSLEEIRLLEINENNKGRENFLKCLSEGALLIKEYIKAEVADVYIVEDKKVCKLLYKYGFSSKGFSWPIGPGTVVSAYVAHLCKNVILNENSLNHSLHPLGIGRGLRPVHLLSTPLLTDDGHCEAVFEFYHTTSKTKFTRAETDICSCMVAWLGHSITTKTVQYASSVETYQSLFNAIGRFQASHTDPEILIYDALKILKNAVAVEEVNYYEVLKGRQLRCRLRAQVGHETWQCFPEYIFKKGDVIRTVIENHTHLNMSKDDISSLTVPLKYQFKGVFSYLCVPIGIASKTRGVVELKNKKNSDAFSDEDMDEATRCGIHCVAGLLYHRLYLKKQKTFAMCENQIQTLLHNMNPCPHELDVVECRKANLNIPDCFFKLTYYPLEEEFPNLTFYAWYIFQNVFNGHQRDNALSDKLLNFILKTKEGYRNLPYHNFEHAFAFCHCIYVITGKNSGVFSNLERKALITAGICHDIDHPGTTNKYIQDSQHYLTVLYYESFLENHHSSMCRMLVQNCGIFSDLNSEEYESVIRTINMAILATDLSLHFSVRYKMMDILMNDRFSMKNKTHKEMLMSVLMTACDLCGQCKTFRVSERLCRNLYKEFYAEADLAAQFGVEPVCVMNKLNYHEVPKYQVQFNSEVSLPCFYILSAVLENTKELHEQCYDVCEKWDKISSSGSDWNVFTEEYIYPA